MCIFTYQSALEAEPITEDKHDSYPDSSPYLPTSRAVFGKMQSNKPSESTYSVSLLINSHSPSSLSLLVVFTHNVSKPL